MASRPGTLPFNLAIATGQTPNTELSTNFSYLLGILNDSGSGWTTEAVDTGTTNNIIVALASPPVSYQAGMMLCVVPANTNTAACVINVNALGNVAIVNPSGIALSGGEISANAMCTLIFDGTAFRIIGPCPLNATFITASSIPVECAGYTSIYVTCTFTAVSRNIALNHVSYGVPIILVLGNTSGATSGFSVTMTDPAGVAISTVNALPSGSNQGVGFISMGSGGTTIINNGVTLMFTGSLAQNGAAHFMR